MVPETVPCAEVIVFRPALDDPFPIEILWHEKWLARPTGDDVLDILRGLPDEVREELWAREPKWD